MKIKIEKLLCLEARYERLGFVIGPDTDAILKLIYERVNSCINSGPTCLKQIETKASEYDKYYDSHIENLAKLNGAIYTLYETALEERENVLEFDFGDYAHLIPPYKKVNIKHELDPAAELLRLSDNISDIRNLKIAIEVKAYEHR